MFETALTSLKLGKELLLTLYTVEQDQQAVVAEYVAIANSFLIMIITTIVITISLLLLQMVCSKCSADMQHSDTCDA